MEVIKIEKWSEVPVNFTGIVLTDRAKYWHLNGKFHREGGPAVEWNGGSIEWYQYGEFHCESGPALNYIDGTKHWYLNGKLFKTKEEWFQALTPKKQEEFIWSVEFGNN